MQVYNSATGFVIINARVVYDGSPSSTGTEKALCQRSQSMQYGVYVSSVFLLRLYVGHMMV